MGFSQAFAFLGIEIFDYEILPMLTDFVAFFCFQSCSEKENVLKYDFRNSKATVKLPAIYRPVNKERLEGTEQERR